MAVTAIEPYKFIRRLEQAGMPVEHAEIQAEVLSEAFTVNFEELVNKEFLAVRFAAQKCQNRYAVCGAGCQI